MVGFFRWGNNGFVGHLPTMEWEEVGDVVYNNEVISADCLCVSYGWIVSDNIQFDPLLGSVKDKTNF